MIQLEQKIYTKAEIAEILGINIKDSHFKRNVENTLTKWGYEYEYPSYSKTITIKYVPCAEDKLSEILIREYGLDIQINPTEFACFIHAFNNIDGFVSMPWGERVEQLKEKYGIEICDKTLRNWTNKLIAAGAIIKSDYNKTYWKSTKITDTYTIRERATREEFSDYYKYKNEVYKNNIAELIITGNEDLQKVKAEAYKQAHIAAMNKFNGWCYYSCKSFELSAFDENSLAEVFEIVEDIAPWVVEYKNNELAAAKEKVNYEIANLIVSEKDFYF